MFGALAPAFNIEGKKLVKTYTGASTSMLVLTLTFLFALLKLELLVERKNPSLTSNKSQLDIGERYNTGSEDFIMAFSAINLLTKEAKSDPRYVRWLVHFYENTD